MEPNGDETSYRLSDYLRLGVFFTLYGIVKYLPSPLGDGPRRAVIGNKMTLNEWVHIDGPGSVITRVSCASGAEGRKRKKAYDEENRT